MFFEGCYRFFDIPDDRLKPIVGGAPSNWGLECVLEALMAYVIACVAVSVSLHAYFLLKRKIHGFAWPPDNWAQFGENRFERFIGKIYNFGGLLLIAVVVAPLMVLMVGLTYLSLGAWAFDALMRRIAFLS